MSSQQEFVILVDRDDNEIGTMEKMEAHEKGLLHRAFSILIFNDKGELLLHRRAVKKYHSGGLWTNTCCSHPRIDETMDAAVHRRLQEEMGFDTELKFLYKFVYNAPLDKNLSEHELDYVYLGKYNTLPKWNTDEVMDAKFIALSDLIQDLKTAPESYTEWFKLIVKEIVKEKFNIEMSLDINL